MSPFAWLYYIANVALLLYSLAMGCPHPLPWVLAAVGLLGYLLFQRQAEAAVEAMPGPLRAMFSLSALGFLCLYIYAWTQGWPAPLPRVLFVWEIVNVGLFLAGWLR